jgi:ribosomal-protein-alanine N-acetyltransferase
MERAHHITIRAWRPDDAATLARLADDRGVWLGLRDLFPHPYQLADAHRFIAFAAGMSPVTYFAIEADGVLAGGIGYTPRTDVERIGAEVGYWLGREFWGRGIGTRALSLFLAPGEEETRPLYAEAAVHNVASVRALKRHGFDELEVVEDGPDEFVVLKLG